MFSKLALALNKKVSCVISALADLQKFANHFLLTQEVKSLFIRNGYWFECNLVHILRLFNLQETGLSRMRLTKSTHIMWVSWKCCCGQEGFLLISRSLFMTWRVNMIVLHLKVNNILFFFFFASLGCKMSIESKKLQKNKVFGRKIWISLVEI